MADAQTDEETLRARLRETPGSWRDLYELANLLYKEARYNEGIFVLRSLLNNPRVPYKHIRATVLLLFTRTVDQFIGLGDDWSEHDDLAGFRARLAARRQEDCPERTSFIVLLEEATEALRIAFELWPINEPTDKALLCSFYAEHLRLLGIPDKAAEMEVLASQIAARAA